MDKACRSALFFLIFSSYPPTFGQISFVLKTAPSIHLPDYSKYVSTFFYTNPNQIFMNSDALLRLQLADKFYIGTGVSFSTLKSENGCVSYPQNLEPNLAPGYFTSNKNCRLSMTGSFQTFGIPLEFGMLLAKPKSKKGFSINISYLTSAWFQKKNYYKGDTPYGDKADFKGFKLFPFDVNASFGGFYRLNPKSLLFVEGTFGIHKTLINSKSIGTNFGLSYML